MKNDKDAEWVELDLTEEEVALIREITPFEMDMAGHRVMLSIDEDTEETFALRISLVKEEDDGEA